MRGGEGEREGGKKDGREDLLNYKRRPRKSRKSKKQTKKTRKLIKKGRKSRSKEGERVGSL